MEVYPVARRALMPEVIGGLMRVDRGITLWIVRGWPWVPEG